jgi:hypothetical protein
MLGSTCTWNGHPGNERYFLNLMLDVLSQLTCVGNLANYLEGEAAWKTVRKSVETIALLIGWSLSSYRSWDMLTMTTTHALRPFICVARYGSIFNGSDFVIM